jgi:hypothetical protein
VSFELCLLCFHFPSISATNSITGSLLFSQNKEAFYCPRNFLKEEQTEVQEVR